MKRETALKGLACLDGIFSAGLDSYYIVARHGYPLSFTPIPYLGAQNMLFFKPIEPGYMADVNSYCYKGTALFSAAGILYAGYPVAAIDILAEQAYIAPKLFNWVHDIFHPEHTLVDNKIIDFEAA